mgnify:CR=1 FL=1
MRAGAGNVDDDGEIEGQSDKICDIPHKTWLKMTPSLMEARKSI